MLRKELTWKFIVLKTISTKYSFLLKKLTLYAVVFIKFNIYIQYIYGLIIPVVRCLLWLGSFICIMFTTAYMYSTNTILILCV